MRRVSFVIALVVVVALFLSPAVSSALSPAGTWKAVDGKLTLSASITGAVSAGVTLKKALMPLLPPLNFSTAPNIVTLPLGDLYGPGDFSVLCVQPSMAKTDGGNTVTVYGTGFEDGATVTIGGESATDVTFINAQALTVTVPPSAVQRLADVVVTNPDTASATLVEGFFYLPVWPTFEITSVLPYAGPFMGGTTVEIHGTGFEDGATVKFGDTDAAGVTFHDSTWITAVTPQDLPQSVNVRVFQPSLIEASLLNGFTYLIPDLVGTWKKTGLNTLSMNFNESINALLDALGVYDTNYDVTVVRIFKATMVRSNLMSANPINLTVTFKHKVTHRTVAVIRLYGSLKLRPILAVASEKPAMDDVTRGLLKSIGKGIQGFLRER